MRILIDECLDWRLCRALSDHECASVRDMGWLGFTNGALLKLAEQKFDVLLTGDHNLSFQQKVTELQLAVVVLKARSTRLRDTLLLIPRVLVVLPALRPGDVVTVTASD